MALLQGKGLPGQRPTTSSQSVHVTTVCYYKRVARYLRESGFLLLTICQTQYTEVVSCHACQVIDTCLPEIQKQMFLGGHKVAKIC